MSTGKVTRKGLIYSAFEGIGDLCITGIRLWRILRSRRARRIHAHRKKVSQREEALEKKREDWEARQRRRGKGKPRRTPGPGRLLRLERIRLHHFFRQTSPSKLLALFLGIAGITLVIVISLFAFSSARPRTQAVPRSPAQEKPDLRTLQNETARLLADNRLDEAERNLAVLDELAPDTFIVLSHHAALHMLRKEYPAARTAFSRALELKPDSYVTRYNLAEAEFLLKNYAGAESLFLQMHETNPEDEIILFRLALCALRQNSTERFDRYLKKFPPAGRSPARQYTIAARLIHDQKTAEADRLIQQVRIIFGNQTTYYDTTFREMGLVK